MKSRAATDDRPYLSLKDTRMTFCLLKMLVVFITSFKWKACTWGACNSSNMISASFVIYIIEYHRWRPQEVRFVSVRLSNIHVFCLQERLQSDYPDMNSHSSKMCRSLSFSVLKENEGMNFFPQGFLFVCFSLWVG